MTPLHLPSVGDTFSLLDVISIPKACPLKAVYESARWRRSLPCGGKVWLDLSCRFSKGAQSTWSIDGMCQDSNGTFKPVSLAFPSNGFDLGRQLDWFVVNRMLSAFTHSASARREFMQMQAEGICEHLKLGGIQWFAETGKGTLQQAGGLPSSHARSLQSVKPFNNTHRWAVLGYESAEGAIWILHAPQSYLLSWWRTGQHAVSARALSAVESRLLSQPQRLQLSLALMSLTEAHIRSLEVGSIIRLMRGHPPESASIPGELVPASYIRFQPFQFTAAIDLRVQSDAEGDRIELQWRYFMSHPEHLNLTESAKPMVTERVASRLTCVIADIELSLEDLLHLQPGDLLPSVAVTTPLLDLRIGNQQVGTGELVRLGDALAVQIIEWNMSDTGVQAHEQSV